MLKKLLLFPLAFLVLFFSACSQKTEPLRFGYSSLESLTQHMASLLIQGREETFRELMLSDGEFKASVHPQLSKNPKNNMPAQDYIFFVRTASEKGINNLFKEATLFKDASFSFGKPAKTEKWGDLIVHKNIPLIIKSGEQEFVSDKVFSAVVEKDGLFRLWSTTYGD